MRDAVELVVGQSMKRGPKSKFTPERIQQIINLVERGKTRDEIAALIGVTTATLQVTCSKLAISLRRRHFDNGVRLFRPKEISSSTATDDAEPGKAGATAAIRPRESEKPLNQTANSHSMGNAVVSRQNGKSEPMSQTGNGPSVDTEMAFKSNCETKSPNQTDNTPSLFAIHMHYKGQERAFNLPLSAEIVQKLALEAEFRDTRITELLIKIISHVAENDLFRLVLGDQGVDPASKAS
jgi:hypothetical protein